METRWVVFRAFLFHETDLAGSRREKRAKKQKGGIARPCTLEAEGCRLPRDNLPSFLPSFSTLSFLNPPTPSYPADASTFVHGFILSCTGHRLASTLLSRYNNSAESDFPATTHRETEGGRRRRRWKRVRLKERSSGSRIEREEIRGWFLSWY